MRLRRALAVLLVLMLSVTSVTAAVARGQMAGAVDLVICAGGGVATVTLDAAGQPVTRVHHCPVCTAASASMEGAAAPAVLRPETRAADVGPVAVLDVVSCRGVVAVARGPPVRA